MSEGVAPLLDLDPQALSARLRALAGEERNVQADFLLHLDALDRRRGFAELGYPSLWGYCLRALHLCEGAAGRRIGAMRVLRRFPRLEGELRAGRLGLSTLCLLGPALTDDNVAGLTERAAFKTKAEVEAIVASVRPWAPPQDGLRRVSSPPAAASSVTMSLMSLTSLTSPPAAPEAAPRLSPTAPAEEARSGVAGGLVESTPVVPLPSVAAVPSPFAFGQPTGQSAELRPVAVDRWSLRVTVGTPAKKNLETLIELLAHKIPRRDLAAVVEEALRCAAEVHAKRRGAPTEGAAASPRGRAPHARQAANGSAIPMDVRREVWARDGGRCTFVAADGTRCDSRWQLELDHVEPRALGGPATTANLRLRCKTHNLLHAEAVFGADHMARYRRRRNVATRSGSVG